MVGGQRGVEAASRLAVGALGPRGLAAVGRDMKVWQKVLGVVALVGLNVALLLAPFDYSGLGTFAYVGAFLITFVANAAVVLPVPYVPIVAHLATTAEIPALVVVLAATGSALGESVAFLVGRVEKDLFTGHRWYERLRGFFAQEWRAALFLFLFAVPLNPIFDVGGLGAGALGIRFRTFFAAVWLGRIVRISIIAAIASGVLAAIPVR